MHRTTTIRLVSWSDGENPTSKDGCPLLIVKLSLAAGLLLLALRAVLGGR